MKKKNDMIVGREMMIQYSQITSHKKTGKEERKRKMQQMEANFVVEEGFNLRAAVEWDLARRMGQRTGQMSVSIYLAAQRNIPRS